MISFIVRQLASGVIITALYFTTTILVATTLISRVKFKRQLQGQRRKSMSGRRSVLQVTTLLLRIWMALASSGRLGTPRGASSSVQIFAMIAADAPALSTQMALSSTVHVALTQVVTVTWRGTQTATRMAQTGSAASIGSAQPLVSL